MHRLPPAALTFLTALAAPLALVYAFPDNIGLDGFQRWAGRDWILVQEWLPAAQGIVWVGARLGLGPTGIRVVFAAMSAAALAVAAGIAERLGGRTAGAVFAAVGAFGPFALWGAALYQEGLFLLLFLGGVSLALGGRTAPADLLVGAAALVRYEAWPLAGLYVLWRREPPALVAGWGALAWLGARFAFGWEGHAASPVDYFSDWHGLAARFAPGAWARDAARLLELAWRSGGLVWIALGAASLRGGADRTTKLFAALVVTQGAVVAAWMVGLERATARMLVVPVVLAAIPAAVRIARWWDASRGRYATLLGLAALVGVGVGDGWSAAARERAFSSPERTAAARMAESPGTRWWVVPRTGLGPRDRHDGCELLQGVSALAHGEDFLCAAWPADANRASDCDGVVSWDGRAYAVTKGVVRR